MSARTVQILFLLLSWLAAGNEATGQAIGLDRSFGDSGVVTTDFGGGTDIGIDLLLLPDGKLVLAGWSGVVGNSDLAFARYHPDGSLDTAFGMAGRVIIDIRPEDRIFEGALQAGGKIVAVGLTGAALNSPRDFVVVRLNADGTLDKSFGANGVVTTDVDSHLRWQSARSPARGGSSPDSFHG